MEKITIVPVVTDEQISQTASLADEIWHQHFTPIIGDGQVEYMLDKFQSAAALKQQLQEGYQYFLLTYEKNYAGYSGMQVRDNGLFLSKLYIKESFRGKKISKAILEYYESLCRSRGLSKIWLTCNRDNRDTLAVYERLGFQITDTQVADIGNGFVMDDYILTKPIPN